VNHDLSQVQVGDFGLACCLQHSSDDVTLMVHPSSEHPLMHKGEIGTKLYAAPEQLRGKCDSKVSTRVGHHELSQDVSYNLSSMYNSVVLL
jgi:serine/threonine protein kinase